MMKKLTFVFSILLLFGSLNLAAQYVDRENGLVNIVAYWDVGDSYQFDYETMKLKVLGNDTTQIENNKERFRLEVESENETGYVLRYDLISYDQTFDSEIERTIFEQMIEWQKSVPVKIQLTDMGEYVDLYNWEEIEAALPELLRMGEELIVGLFAEMEGTAELDPKQLAANMLQPMMHKNAIVGSMDYVLMMLKYHGRAIPIDDPIEWSEKRQSLLGDELIDTECVAWISTIGEDDSYVTIKNQNTMDADQLMEATVNYLTKSIDANSDVSYDSSTFPNLRGEDYLGLNIHMATGWPTYSYYEKEVGTGEESSVEIRTVEIVLE